MQLLLAIVCLTLPPGDAPLASPDFVVRGQILDLSGPCGGVKVQLRGVTWDSELKLESETNLEGEFEFHFGNPDTRAVRLFVLDSKNNRFGFEFVDACYAQLSPCAIHLEPIRKFPVAVVDAVGLPVAKASVALELQQGRYRQESTNEKGIANFEIGAGSQIKCIYAFKSNVGLDYIRYRLKAELPYHAGWVEDRPGKYPTLTLSRLQTKALRIVDETDRPVYGARVKSVSLRLPNKGALLWGPWLGEVSDEHGKLDVHWPVAGVPPRRLTVTAGGFATHPFNFEVESEMSDVRIKKDARLTGQVVNAKLRPARHATITAKVASRQPQRLQTDENGRFALYAPLNAACILVGACGSEVSPPFVFVPRDEDSLTELRLNLEPAVHIHGNVLESGSGEPKSGVEFWVNLKRDTNTINWMTSTNSAGEFGFWGPRGDYAIQSPVIRTKNFSVRGPEEAEFLLDLAVDQPRRLVLRGKVHAKDPSGIILQGFKHDALFATHDFVTTTGSDGSFQCEKLAVGETVFAATPDQTQAAVFQVDADVRLVNVTLKPTLTAKGRLVDGAGMPIAAEEVRCYADFSSRVYDYTTLTNDKGDFEFRGLLSQQNYTLGTQENVEMTFPIKVMKTFKVQDSDVDLGSCVHSAQNQAR